MGMEEENDAGSAAAAAGERREEEGEEEGEEMAAAAAPAEAARDDSVASPEAPASAAAPGKEGNGPVGAAPGEVDGGRVYPAPLLAHDEVVGNPDGFHDVLRRFHSLMGTKFMVPVIGGKELNLYILYAEVTRRGGLEKVTVDRRWREVIAVFKFPPTTTSASFVLRKYYVSLLHHFEQVHFHRRRGSLVPPPASLHAKSSPPFKPDDAPESSQHQQLATMKRKRAFSGMQAKAAPVGFTVTGTIDGKFEHGYMVTVKMGSETLHGVLYHALAPSAPPSSSLTAPAAAAAPYDVAVGKTHRRRKKGRKNRDPAHPKPNRSAYNFFFAEKHSKLKALYPHREREFSKMIGESWSKLTDEERTVYQDCGQKDKERYRREMQEYRERLKLPAMHGAAYPQEDGRAQSEEVKAKEAEI